MYATICEIKFLLQPTMLSSIRRLFNLLTSRQKRDFYLLQIVMLSSSVAELIGTISILPFMALAGNPEIVHKYAVLRHLNLWLGEPSPELFLIYVGIVFTFFVILSNSLLFLSQLLMSRYSMRLGAEISSRLYRYYLSKDILYHARTNSARLIQNLMRESQQISVGLIGPTLQLNARLFSIVMLTALVIYVDPRVALSALILLSFVYLLIYRIVRSQVLKNSSMVSRYNRRRNRMLNESLTGVREVKLYSQESRFLTNYRELTRSSTRGLANNQALAEFPYYFVESIVFSGMVLLVLILSVGERDLAESLPTLTLFGLAGIKLVPKIQQSYRALVQIRAAQAPFEILFDDLKNSMVGLGPGDFTVQPIRVAERFGVKDIGFSYPDAKKPLFRDFSISLDVGAFTAITGPSGVGKSTLLDIMMGLVKPDGGSIVVDGKAIHESDLQAWRASVGYVTQDIYMADSTPAENIALGISLEEIDIDRVRAVAKMAMIDDFISGLPQGYFSPVAEGGRLFSGGQRQRIGFARALYRNVRILFLDEATSALDQQTQEAILRNIKASEQFITVVMVTHRRETVELADRVVDLEQLC
ncbi:hypothetical protein A3709_10900 [Halioglobus sp. HI00S01]|uniref:ABC transporter ATP-binding protein n=1 Tax=Halioglobus sp. HI00S01 TaxID=1822214 RepID=UPI0007C3C7EB|nr:ABC transporter ATP-binding protein [Halioglobus sp. HI00S01]KZX51318.1 hypothetical protein A3709_10900 [Halioglobus sp. HI00S01]